MRLGDLSQAEVAARIGGTGLTVRIGPFDVRLRSNDRTVAEVFRHMYRDFAPVPEPALVDFHLAVSLRRRLTAPWRRSVECWINGQFGWALPQVHLAPLLAEWGLNLCIGTRAHRYLIFHAAVVERHGRAIIMPAPPGSGKSTLCAALIHHGWRLLSDEICLLRPEDGTVVPLPRPIALKERSIDLIRELAPGLSMGPRFSGTAKGDLQHLLPPSAHVQRQNETAEPAWIIFPRWQAGTDPLLTAVEPAECFMALIRNSMNYELMGADGFSGVTRLTETSSGFSFVYDDLEQAVTAVNAMAGRELRSIAKISAHAEMQ